MTAIDGDSTEGVGLSDLEGRLKGPVGTTVVVEVQRGNRTLKISIKREMLR